MLEEPHHAGAFESELVRTGFDTEMAKLRSFVMKITSGKTGFEARAALFAALVGDKEVALMAMGALVSLCAAPAFLPPLERIARPRQDREPPNKRKAEVVARATAMVAQREKQIVYRFTNGDDVKAVGVHELAAYARDGAFDTALANGLLVACGNVMDPFAKVGDILTDSQIAVCKRAADKAVKDLRS